MKVTAKATLSEYYRGAHFIDGNIIPFHSGSASIRENMTLFKELLETLGHAEIRTGTKLKITIETIPIRRKRR